ncbi:MAG: hydrolase [Rhodospirillaceae bacterium]|nr:hydrolase [Rhodospirillaceae bacterium]MDE0619292.1 hydrolase [Rhodospirillaceae bacterium]
MMNADSSQLLLIDIQERLAPATLDGARVVERAGILLDAAALLGVPHTVSEQYPRGLGPTVAAVREKADPERIFDKVHFSCQADDRLAAVLAETGAETGAKTGAETGRRDAILCGMEAHVCVLQTALDLAGAGYRVHVVADAVTSRTAENRDLAVERMRTAGIGIVSTEMVLFEWLRTAGHPEFRAVSALIR